MNERARHITYAPGISLIPWEKVENDEYIKNEFEYALENGDFRENEFDEFVEKYVWVV